MSSGEGNLKLTKFPLLPREKSKDSISILNFITINIS